MNHDTAVVIPIYNEAKVIKRTISGLTKEFTTIICVDDGSKDGSDIEIGKTPATLVKHPVNLGQGAALQTGIEYALQDRAVKYILTFDADGQHRVEDAKAMVNYIKCHDVDIVLGSRFLGSSQGMPRIKSLILKLAVHFSNFTSGVKLSDTHNGLRVLIAK